jgi:hypothetical protein
VATWQVPSPLQPDFVSVPLAQLSAAHAVPLAYSLHAPLPLQKPSRWQVEARSMVHSLSGSVLAAILPHAPSAPEPFLAAEHAWHVPVHGASQQNPSMQVPLAHCEADVHGAAAG